MQDKKLVLNATFHEQERKQLFRKSFKQMIKFFQIEGTFSELYPERPHENISNFKKYILRLTEAYRGPRTLEMALSLTNLKRTLNRTL